MLTMLEEQSWIHKQLWMPATADILQVSEYFEFLYYGYVMSTSHFLTSWHLEVLKYISYVSKWFHDHFKGVIFLFV